MHSVPGTTTVVTPPVEKNMKEQALVLADLCFNSERTKEQQAEHDDQFCSQGDRQKFVFALQGEKVIGSVTVLKRSIPFNGRKIILGGLGGVCTHPSQRKQGIATSLVGLAVEELKKLGCDVAYLCTDIDDPQKAGLYKKFGFQALPVPHTYVGASGKRYTESDGMVAPINSDEIFQEILASAKPFDIGTGNW